MATASKRATPHSTATATNTPSRPGPSCWPKGSWKQFKGFTSKPGSEGGIMLGVAANIENEEFGTPAGPEERDIRATADMSIMGDGWNLFGAFVYQDLKVADTNPWGFLVQGGVYINDDTELFARYEYGDNDDTSEQLSVITAGLNKYFNKNVKWTTDIGFALNEVAGSWDKSGVGWLEDAPGTDGQIVFRTQLQLLF